MWTQQIGIVGLRRKTKSFPSKNRHQKASIFLLPSDVSCRLERKNEKFIFRGEKRCKRKKSTLQRNSFWQWSSKEKFSTDFCSIWNPWLSHFKSCCLLLCKMKKLPLKYDRMDHPIFSGTEVGPWKVSTLFKALSDKLFSADLKKKNRKWI